MNVPSDLVERLKRLSAGAAEFAGRLGAKSAEAGAMSEAASRIEALEAALLRVRSELDAYIDKHGSTDVTIAIAFEASRAALGSEQ